MTPSVLVYSNIHDFLINLMIKSSKKKNIHFICSPRSQIPICLKGLNGSEINQDS